VTRLPTSNGHRRPWSFRAPSAFPRSSWVLRSTVQVVLLSLLALSLAGCGHPTSVSPSPTTVERRALTPPQTKSFTRLARRYYGYLRTQQQRAAVSLFDPRTRARAAHDLVVADLARVAGNRNAGRISTIRLVSVRQGVLGPPVGFVQIYASEAQRLQTLARTFSQAVIICFKTSDGASRKMLAVEAANSAGSRVFWLLP
jgi:hypothetical protein